MTVKTYVNDTQLDRLLEIMSGSGFPWFIAGGWAIDMAIGRKTREHKDLDIVVFRGQLQDVLDYFAGWDIGVAIPGEHRLEPVTDKEQVESPRYCLHIRKDADFVEVLLTDRGPEGEIVYRRDPTQA